MFILNLELYQQVRSEKFCKTVWEPRGARKFGLASGCERGRVLHRVSRGGLLRAGRLLRGGLRGCERALQRHDLVRGAGLRPAGGRLRLVRVRPRLLSPLLGTTS